MRPALNKTAHHIRKRVSEKTADAYFRFIFVFCLGFYFGQATHYAPQAIDTVKTYLIR